MTFPASGCFANTFTGALKGTIALDLTLATHKVALYTNAVGAADLTTDVGYNAGGWTTGEVANGGGYTTGGALIVSPTYAHTAGGVVMWDAADPSWATATITARGAMYYANALAGKNGIVAQTFGADIVSTGGTFLITLAAGGLFSVDWVP